MSNPLPGTRCCFNCQHWAGTHGDEEHMILGTCDAHPPIGTNFQLHCDDFSGRMDVEHLGDAANYPEGAEELRIGVWPEPPVIDMTKLPTEQGNV